MENYIVINGKKTELTEEQLKQLGIETEEKEKKNPFARSERYSTILSNGAVAFNIIDDHSHIEDKLYENVNYFNNVNFAQQVSWHELLYRKLLRYAYDHEAEDCEWDEVCVNPHYYIYFDNTKGHFIVEENHYCHSQNVYFSKKDIAEQAIENVVKPFMKKHPEFVW